jgi:GNAT superfamily N-acetyltransferase
VIVRIVHLPQEFDHWGELLALISRAFAYMDGVIDPPSSARRLTAESLKEKARGEVCIVARAGGRLVGCAFAAERGDHFYLGKLAVDPAVQGAGIGRALVNSIEEHAALRGKPILELQTRIELTGNQATFEKLGFVETARTAHAGYDRPTAITYRKTVEVPARA